MFARLQAFKRQNGMNAEIMKMIHRSIPLFIVAAIFLLSKPLHADLKQFDTSNASVELSGLLSGGPSKDGIPSLNSPQFIKAQEAAYLKGDDEVVGLMLDGEAKAYPIKILNWHEIVNDQIAGRKVAMTWCPLTHSAVAFQRELDGRTLEFGVSGLLYNSNVVMYDRRTNGLWSQLKMSGLTGPHADSELNQIPAHLTTWGKWIKRHPESLVLSDKTGHLRDYGRDPYADYHGSDQMMFSADSSDARLEPKELVAGLVLNGTSKAYPLSNITGLIEDQLAGESIRVQRAENGGVGATDINGNALSPVVVYWFAWSSFYKDTLVYGERH